VLEPSYWVVKDITRYLAGRDLDRRRGSMTREKYRTPRVSLAGKSSQVVWKVPSSLMPKNQTDVAVLFPFLMSI
jgi:hypothetical protein